jgi:hypothetical protein
VNEPNPRATDRARILRFLPLRYPEQREIFRVAVSSLRAAR